MSTRDYRLDNIDLLRGLVIIIMAIDHVRDYFMLAAQQDPMTDPNVGVALFLTRWVTHFCAPVFVLLAGTSAGLMLARKTQAELGGFLFKRGCWLIFIELFVISTAWTFSPFGLEPVRGLILVPMQVIWAIGASMVVLAGLQFLGRRACLLLGLVILLGHNGLDNIWPASQILNEEAAWWVPLHAQASYPAGPFLLVFAYPLLPWVGVILLGFGTAAVFELPAARRDRRLIHWGLLATAGFVLLRAVDVYGDPNPWYATGDFLRSTLDFLNVTKYPPSLLFLLMTLGPAAIFCAHAGRVPEAIRRPLIVFGRAPFAFYVAHLYLIHSLSVALGVYQGFAPHELMTLMFFYPADFGLELSGVYAVWLLVIAALYPFCRWVAAVKARRRDWWLSYV